MWTKHLPCSDNGIPDVLANRPFESLLTNVATVEKTLPKGIVISYATGSPATHLATSSIRAAGIYGTLNMMVDQAMAAPIR